MFLTLPSLLGIWTSDTPEISLAKELRRLSTNLEPVRGRDRASRNETAMKISIDSVSVMNIPRQGYNPTLSIPNTKLLNETFSCFL